MWEAFMESPLGRVFQRKFVMAFATVIVACFAYIFATAPVAHAADASWKDDSNITYNNQSYGSGATGPTSILINNTPASWAKFPGIPHDAPLFINQTIVNGKLEVIYFDPSGDFDATKPNDYLYSSSAHFITYDYNASTKTPSNPSSPSSITITARATRAPPSGNTSCSIDGIGWIVCPVTNFLAQAMDYIFSIVQSFLAVQPLSSSTDKPMYLVWDQMRNIANVAFVIGFLILVYGQITGGLVSNYTLKKMVPRIVIAAILVNVSYLVCQLAVDLGNILGYSINNIFLSMRDHAVSVSGGNGWGDTSWKEVATVLLAGGGAVAIGGIAITSAVVGGGAIFLFIPLLLSVLFVVLMTFLILAARQAIITILIVIAPIAFVAYLLPNTEKWFHKWRDTFVTLLLVFPGFSFIFGGSQLAGSLIIQNANGPNQLVIMILGMAVQVMPLAITPLLLKLGGGVLNRFAGIVNNPTKGLFDKGKNWANERRDEAVSRGNARLSGMNASGTLPRYGFRRMAYRRFASKQEREGEKSANDAMGKAYFTQTAAGQRVSDMTKRAGLEQEYADNRNQARWNNQVRTNSVLRQRSLDSHDAHSRADLYKKNVDAEAEDHWSHTQQTNAAIRAIRTDTHLTEGRAKLAEDAMTNADERQLQTQINGNLALRNLKIGADVDAAHAKLQSDSVAADSKLRFQNEVEGSAQLTAIHTATHVAEGQANLISEALTASADRTLQNQIAASARLANLKTQAITNSGLAENTKKELQTAGEAQLAETILTSPALKQQVTRIHESQGRASQANELIEDEAKQNWQQVTLTDRTIYSRQLERQKNAKQLKEAQDQWESILTEAGAGRTDDYQKKFGPVTVDVSQIVDDIQTADEGIASEGYRKANAEHEFKSSLGKRLKADPSLLKRAAGIDEEGEAKVLASIQEQASKLHMENVSAAKSVLSNDSRYTNDALHKLVAEGITADGKPATSTQRHAAAQRLLLETGNNYAVQDLMDFSESIGVHFDKNDGNTKDAYGNVLSQDEIDARRDMQQIINDAYNKTANKVTWVSGTDRGLAENGHYSVDLKDAAGKSIDTKVEVRQPNGTVRTEWLAGSEKSIVREINAGKLDRDKALGADIDVIDKQINSLLKNEVGKLVTPEGAKQYIDNLEAFLKDPLTGMKLSPRNRGEYHVLLSQLHALLGQDTRPFSEREKSYVDIATGETIEILGPNRASMKPQSKRPGGPISLT